MYYRIYEGDKLTEEGKAWCQELRIAPADLVPKTYDFFFEQVGGVEEVARIRY